MNKKLITFLLTLCSLCCFGGFIACDKSDNNAEEWGESGEGSLGLAYSLMQLDDEYAYCVSGIGLCTDTDVVIPSTFNGKRVASIAPYAFLYCANVTSITVPGSVQSIGMGAFSCSSVQSVTIEEGVEALGDELFTNCSMLTSITFPNSLTTLGERLFDNERIEYNSYNNGFYLGNEDNPYLVLVKAKNNYISNINIHSDTRFIHYGAFEDCSKLTSVIIPDGVTALSAYSFAECESLTSIVIPDSVTTIEYGAFSSCISLTGMVIPDSVTDIGNGAFLNCHQLVSVIIPNSVRSLGEGAFRYCSALTSITVAEDNENYKSIDGNLYTKDETTLIQYAIGKTATEFSIPTSVETIKAAAFYYCSNLTKVVIPKSVTSIENSAFYHCVNLTSITIPNSVSSLGSSAFFSCDNLASVTIGTGIEAIPSHAFSNCTKLTSVLLQSNIIAVESSAFFSCRNLTSIYYNGTSGQWEAIVVDDTNNYYLTKATVYYYSKTEPALLPDGTAYNGNFWHYAKDNVTPVAWVKETTPAA